MSIIGHNYIGGRRSGNGSELLRSIAAVSGEPHAVSFVTATEQEVAAAVAAASDAYPAYRHSSAAERAQFLDTIAEEIDALGDDFIAEVMRETALPAARLQGERSRTSNQMRLFAKVLRRGDFYGARIDTALPQRQPLPRPDVRQLKIGIGPVAVFGASNFPLAFSVAGGDTAAALAAGCPVGAPCATWPRHGRSRFRSSPKCRVSIPSSCCPRHWSRVVKRLHVNWRHRWWSVVVSCVLIRACCWACVLLP